MKCCFCIFVPENGGEGLLHFTDNHLHKLRLKTSIFYCLEKFLFNVDWFRFTFALKNTGIHLDIIIERYSDLYALKIK